MCIMRLAGLSLWETLKKYFLTELKHTFMTMFKSIMTVEITLSGRNCDYNCFLGRLILISSQLQVCLCSMIEWWSRHVKILKYSKQSVWFSSIPNEMRSMWNSHVVLISRPNNSLINVVTQQLGYISLSLFYISSFQLYSSAYY